MRMIWPIAPRASLLLDGAAPLRIDHNLVYGRIAPGVLPGAFLGAFPGAAYTRIFGVPMRTVIRLSLFSVSGALACVLLTACGSGDGDSGGSTPPPITNPTKAPFITGADASTAPSPGTVARLVTSAADSGSGSLREALTLAQPGEVIGFSNTLNGATMHVATTLVITRNVVINAADAPGFMLHGGDSVRIFSVNAGVDATFIGLRLHGGHAVGGGISPGGAISTGNAARLTIRHCRFDANVADIGGAVRAGYGTFTTIEDSTFIGNDGAGAGNGFSAGAISSNGHGSLTVRRCWFERNHGNTGSAIYNLLQPLVVEDCIFYDNDADGPGAAVFTDEGNWVGPSATVGGSIAVRRCWIESNRGHEMGGALFLWANPLDTVAVEDCVLLNNRVAYGGQWNDSKGGALRSMGILTIQRCAFVGNQAEAQGGAVWLDGAGPITIENSTFSGNRVTNDQGGAMTLNVSGPTAIRFCTIVNNTAGRACGAFWFGSPSTPITISSSLVAFNTAGQDHGQDQVGYQPIDGGGNLEFPAPVGNGRKVAAGSLVSDPFLEDVSLSGHMYIRQPTAASPARNAGIANGAPTTDARGAPRDATPDSGASERVTILNSGG